MIKTLSYHGLETGMRLLVLGGVHGNEICGPEAIRQIAARFDAGALLAGKGSVTFVPVANPEAYARDVRFTEHNLNRCMRRVAAPRLYEEKLMNILCPLLESCDVLLDIHSYSAGGPPFILRGLESLREREEAFSASLGVEQLIYGWEDVYAEHAAARPANEAVGTTEYARQFGAAAVTLECGQHRDPANVAVALRAIEGALAYCGITPSSINVPMALRKSRIIKVVFKERDGAFVRPLKHLQSVKAGEALARYSDGVTFTAPCDARLVMPKDDTPIGHEWMYLAIDEN